MSDARQCVQILATDNVTIIDLEGEIDIYTATEFKEAMLRSIDGGARSILVDAAKVTFMDSTGVSVLLSGLQRLRPLDGSLAVVCSARVERLLTVAGLHDHFALYQSRDDALRAAFANPGS